MGVAIPSILLIYGAYWALQIRRALFVRAYRSQALWIAFFSLYFVPYSIGLDAGANGSLLYTLLVTLYYIILAMLLFRLIDVDVRVAHRSDPLLRDTLRWSKLRLVIVSVMIVGAAIVVAVAWLTNTGTPLSDQVVAISQASVYLPFLVTGIPAMLLSARRSGDLTFKRNLKWLALFFMLLLLTTLSYFIITAGLLPVSMDLFNTFGGLAFALPAYCLYRSAKSLAPLSRISVSDPLG